MIDLTRYLPLESGPKRQINNYVVEQGKKQVVINNQTYPVLTVNYNDPMVRSFPTYKDVIIIGDREYRLELDVKQSEDGVILSEVVKVGDETYNVNETQDNSSISNKVNFKKYNTISSEKHPKIDIVG